VIERITFNSGPEGVPIIVEELPGSQAASISIIVRAGSRHENPAKAGTAHLLEHLLFRGTRSRSSREMSEQIENAGGELNGFTDKEYTCYYSSIIQETFPTAREILVDLVFNPRLEEEHFALEKRIVTQEVSMLLDEPESYIHHLFHQTLWEGHPMAMPEAGDLDTVAGIASRDLREFYDEHYLPEEMILVCSGAIDPEEMGTWAASALSSILPHAGRHSPEPPRPLAQIKSFPREGDQAYVAMGFPGLMASDEKRQVQRVLATILGAGMSSRLFQKIREELGLVYSIYSSCRYFSDCGSLGIFFSTSRDHVDMVIELIAIELSRLKNEGLYDGELNRAKRLIKGAMVRKLESTENRMFRLGESYLLTGKVQSVERMLEEIQSVEGEEVLSVAQELLRPERLCAAVHSSLPEEDVQSYASLDF